MHHMVQKTKDGIAAEANLQVVGIDSNLHLLQKENYYEKVEMYNMRSDS